MKYSYLACVCLLVVVVGAEVIYLSVKKENSSVTPFDFSSGNQEAFDAYWSRRIDAVGSRSAYEEFVTQNGALPVGRQHEGAHYMGGLLYERGGEQSLVICDSSFAFGCYHEFLGRAIHAAGLTSVDGLNMLCSDVLGSQALSCQHGIGHGIQSYLGYTLPDLLKSLAVCKGLSNNDPIGGCYGGVFMEYNMRTMLSLDGVGARENREGDIHSPCNAVGKEFVPACYFWEPQWWGVVIEGSVDDRFKMMGALCLEVQGEDVRRECFEGIGNIVGQSANYDPVMVIRLCKGAASSSGSTTYELYCRADAANSFFVLPPVRSRAALVCDGLAGDSKEYCLRYSTNAFNKANQAPMPQP